MPVLPIATSQSAGGVQVADQNDIVAENGVIRTSYNGRLRIDANSVIAGDRAKAVGDAGTCVAIGASSQVGMQAVAVGWGSQATAPGASVLGENASARADYAVALGAQASAESENSVAIGSNPSLASRMWSPLAVRERVAGSSMWGRSPPRPTR